MKSEWTYRPLGELVSFASGGTPSKKRDDYWGGTIPWISAKTLKTENIDTSDLFITEEGLKAGSKIAPKGSILLLTRGSGLFNGIPIARVEKDVAFNQDIKCLDSYGEVENEFIFYWLLSQKDYLMAKVGVTGIGAGKFDLDFLQKLMIPIPSERERKSIVGFASSISEKIRCNAKVNDNLYAQAKATTKQWISKSTGDYELLPLSNIASINPDTYSPKETWKYVNYLDTSSITEGCIAEIQRITPSSEKLPSRARRKIAPNDIVFSTVRPNQRHYGIISEPLPNMLGSTGFAVIRSKNPLVCNELIYLCLTENEFIEKMQQLAEQSTSTFPAIKPSDLGVCEIPCPKDQSYTSFTETLKSLFALIAANQRENISLSEIRDVLLPKLMSGEIDVSDIQL